MLVVEFSGELLARGYPFSQFALFVLNPQSKTRRTLAMISLILAGEVIFIPPFHLGRYFKSAWMDTFDINEAQIGTLGVIYGIVAAICYLIGGPAADRFSPRRLLPLSLIATGLGSMYMATFPSYRALQVLYGFWGGSTILLFWAPLIRATREWGKTHRQGITFGVLDGGRGLAAAIIAWLSARLFTSKIAEGAEVLTMAQKHTTLQSILTMYFIVTVLAAICVWLFVPDPESNVEPASPAAVEQASLWDRLLAVSRMPQVWLQAVVILCAYSAFKMFDYYGLYAEDAYAYTPAESARTTANLSFIRVFATVGAGWMADRLFGTAYAVAACFALLAMSYACLIYLPTDQAAAGWMLASLATSCLAFFGLRGIYFALLESTGTPRKLTGTAVGVICVVGFLPEIYMPPLTGWLVTTARTHGDVLHGYRQMFGLLTALSLLGLVAALMLHRMRRESGVSG